jgi:hypothetical protein
MCPRIARMWVNQPSTHQMYHKLDGQNVLAVTYADGSVRIWFLSGPVISQEIHASALSNGWKV